MGCSSSSNAAEPGAADPAGAATEVSANALPAASQEIAVPDSAVAPAATVRDPTSSAAPPSPAFIEGLSRYTAQNDKCILARVR
jgi:hypothetical protein